MIKEVIMTISLNLSRNECIQAIGNKEIEQLVDVTIQHFAIPTIAGFSMDDISQQQYEMMRGGRKPEPISAKAKLEMYTRIKTFMKEKILSETAKLVNSVLVQSLQAYTDEELRHKVASLSHQPVITEPNWKIFPELVKDHTCLFKDLAKTTTLKANLIAFHDKLCPIMCTYRDSGELFARININEFQT